MSIKKHIKTEAVKSWINSLSATPYGITQFKPGQNDSFDVVSVFETMRIKDLELVLLMVKTAYNKGCEDTRQTLAKNVTVTKEVF